MLLMAAEEEEVIYGDCGSLCRWRDELREGRQAEGGLEERDGELSTNTASLRRGGPPASDALRV